MFYGLFGDGFLNCPSVFTKSVAKMTFGLAYILDVAFVALYHIDEIKRSASDVMSCASLFVGREKGVRCGSLCNERTRLPTYFCDNGKLLEPRGLVCGVWP